LSRYAGAGLPRIPVGRFVAVLLASGGGLDGLVGQTALQPMVVFMCRCPAMTWAMWAAR